MVMMTLKVALGIKRENRKVLTKVRLKGGMEIKVDMENNKKEEIKNNSTKEDE